MCYGRSHRNKKGRVDEYCCEVMTSVFSFLELFSLGVFG